MLSLSSISSNRLQTFIATTISSATLQLSTTNNNNHTNNNSYDQNISIPPSLLTCSHDRGNIVALFNFANLFFTPIFMYGLLSLLMMKLYHRRYGLLCFLGALLLLLCEICDSVDISLDVIIYRRILGTNSGSGSGSNRAAIAYIVYSILFDIVKYLSLTLGFLLLFFGSYYAVYFHHRNHGMSSVSDEEDDTGGMGQSRINHVNGNGNNHMNGSGQSGGDDGDNNRSRSSSSGSSNSDMVMHEINLRFNDQYRHRESMAHVSGGAASMIHGQFGMKTKQFQRTMWRRRLCRIIVPIICLVIIAFCTIGIGLLIDVLVLYPKYKKEQASESATTSSIASSMHASSTLRDTPLLTDQVPQHDHHSAYRMTSGDLSSSLLSSSLTPTLLSPPETDRTNQQQDETQHLSSTDSTMIDMSSTMMMMNTQANNGTVSDNTVTVKPELWKTSLIISVILFQLGIGVVLIWLCFHFISSRSALVIASSLYALCIVSQIVSTILFALEDFAAYHNGVWCMAFRYFRIAANFVSFLLFVLPSLLVFIGVRRHNRNVESYRHLTERFLDQVPVRPKSRETRRFSSSTINGFNYDIDEEYMT